MKKLPDPRVIFAFVLFFSSFGVLIRKDVLAMAALLAFAFFCALIIGVDLCALFKRFKRLWQIMIIVTILRSFFAPQGLVLISFFDIPILTAGGIAIGLVVALRLILFIVSAAMFTVYPVRALIQAMVQVRMPYEIAYMVSIGVRFVPLMAEELKDSLTALQLRGVVIEELKMRKRLSLYTYLLLPVIVSSIQQARELAMSMEMRAFRAMSQRTSYYKLALSSKDLALLFAVAVLSITTGLMIFGF